MVLALFSFILSSVAVIQPTCVCPPGFGLKDPCRRQNSLPVCEECKAGYFSDGNTSECHPCRECPRGQEVKESCRADKDTECQCPTGSRFSPVILQCIKCLPCPSGEGVIRPCTNSNDTVCDKCPEGQSSASNSPTEECRGQSNNGIDGNTYALWFGTALPLVGVVVGGLYCLRRRRVRQRRRGMPVETDI